MKNFLKLFTAIAVVTTSAFICEAKVAICFPNKELIPLKEGQPWK